MENTYHFKKSNSNKLLIIFSAAGAKPHRFHFWSAGHAMSCHILYVKEEYGKNYFYQHGIKGIGDINQSIEFIKAYCAENGITQIYTTGQSMGAYGALHYGSLLNARILLFSPLAIAEHSPKLDSETVMSQPDLREVVTQSSASIHFYAGELDAIDLYNARLLIKLENVTGTSLRDVDHGVASYFLAKRTLNNLLLSLVEDSDYPPSLNEGDAVHSQKYSQHLYKAQINFDKENYEQAIVDAKIAIGGCYHAVKGHEILGMSAFKLNLLQESAQAYATSNMLLPSIESSYWFAACLRRMGHFNVAKDYYKKILVAFPNHDLSLYDLSLIYKQRGELLTSVRYCAQALELVPNHPGYQKRFKILSNEIQEGGFDT